MNNEAEAIQQFVVWLLQTLDPANGAPSGDWNQAAEPEQTGSVNLQFSAEPLSSAGAEGILRNANDPSDRIDRTGQPTSNPENTSMPLDEDPSQLAFGDIPAVQHRFHALLKNKLKTEIERNPPRFPWETEQHDYHYDSPYDSESYAYPDAEQPHTGERLSFPVQEPVPIWAAHLKTLNLPIALPDAVLQSLFEQCCHLMQSSLREGRRLVQAVESLFPEEGAVLNELAGMVLASPVRGGTSTEPKPAIANPGFLTDYNQASRPQQMVLSLLAAREMFEAMTLTLSPRAAIRRSWLTDAGAIMLEVQYHPESGTVRIDAQLPTGGTVRFQQAALESIASCTQAGNLSVSLSPICVEQSMTLAIELAKSDAPLVFAVRLPLEP